MAHVDQFLVVEAHSEIGPEGSCAVAVVVLPVVVHPGQGIGPVLVPGVQEVEGVTYLVDVGIQEMAHGRCLSVIRWIRHQIAEPGMVAEDSAALALWSLPGSAVLLGGVEHDASHR